MRRAQCGSQNMTTNLLARSTLMGRRPGPAGWGPVLRVETPVLLGFNPVRKGREAEPRMDAADVPR